MENVVMPSPMDDEDLAWGYRSRRRRYYTKFGLEMPADVTVRFEDFPDSRTIPGLEGLAEAQMLVIGGHFSIIVKPYLAVVYSAAKIALLHEMAHIRVTLMTNHDRRLRHGKLFQAEIDRLYRLGAYRTLL